MSEYKTQEKRWTEREAVLREREAYVRGQIIAHMREKGAVAESDKMRFEAMAKEQYPIVRDKIRVLTDVAGISYRWTGEGDRLEWNYNYQGNGAWERGAKDEWVNGLLAGQGGVPVPTVDRVRLWADIVRQPTEKVITGE